jgi:hypothetical protein
MGLVLRQPIYERDRIDPVDPNATLVLNSAMLHDYPEGYRHIAYLQRSLGMTVAHNLPGIRGVAVETLYRQGDQWLSGEALGQTAAFRKDNNHIA